MGPPHPLKWRTAGGARECHWLSLNGNCQEGPWLSPQVQPTCRDLRGGTTVRHALLGASQSQAKSTDPGLQGQPQESRAGLGRLSGGVEAAP